MISAVIEIHSSISALVQQEIKTGGTASGLNDLLNIA